MPATIQQPYWGRQPLNPALAGLFKNVNRRQSNYIQRGSLISFNYGLWIHDPYPLILVTDIMPGNKIRGLNLHYLTFPSIKQLLRTGGNNPNFSYQNVKANKYITSAFRSYKWQGIRQVKMMDVNFLLTVMATVRSFDPNQVKAIRESVEAQIQRMVNPKA